MATLVGTASGGAAAFMGCHRHPNRTLSSSRVLAAIRICQPSVTQPYIRITKRDSNEARMTASVLIVQAMPAKTTGDVTGSPNRGALLLMRLQCEAFFDRVVAVSANNRWPSPAGAANSGGASHERSALYQNPF